MDNWGDQRLASRISSERIGCSRRFEPSTASRTNMRCTRVHTHVQHTDTHMRVYTPLCTHSCAAQSDAASTGLLLAAHKQHPAETHTQAQRSSLTFSAPSSVWFGSPPIGVAGSLAAPPLLRPRLPVAGMPPAPAALWSCCTGWSGRESKKPWGSSAWLKKSSAPGTSMIGLPAHSGRQHVAVTGRQTALY